MPNLTSLFRNHWSFWLVLCIYLSVVAFLPIQAHAAINDDWIYTRTVEIFLETGQIQILNMSVASLLFQAAWGSIFAWAFSDSLGIFGALRLATLSMVVLSSFFLEHLLNELAISSPWRALGVAAYLFQPIGFALTFTFMTDMYLTSMLLIALSLFVSGFRRGTLNWFTLSGSIVTGLAYLVRQPAVFFLASILVWMILSRHVTFNRRSLQALILVTAPAMLIMALYQYWLVYVHGVPIWQTVFTSVLEYINPLGFLIFGFKFLLVSIIYLGLFALPFTLATLPSLRSAFSKPDRTLLFFLVYFIVLWLAITFQGMRMPYLPHFLNRNGLGPSDLVVGIPPLITVSQLLWLSVLVFLNTLLFIPLVYRLASRKEFSTLLLFVITGQIVAALLPSLVSDNNLTPGLERYLLPALPTIITLVLLALPGERTSQALSWGVILLLAGFSWAGTHDMLQLHQKIWETGSQANQLGIKNQHLDAGASWDGYHLFDNSLPGVIPSQTPRYEVIIETPIEPITVSAPTWWHRLWAPQTDSQYIVSGAPLAGFETIYQTCYYSLLRQKEITLYLLRRP